MCENRAGKFEAPKRAVRRLRTLQDMKDTEPTLTVINGGKDEQGMTSRKRSALLPNGLTEKQEAFCVAVSNGASNSDAFRKSFNTENMQASTVHEHASRLAAKDKIKARIEQLFREKSARNSMFTEKQREKYSDRVWRNLWAMIDNPETPPAVKANLLSLGAKAAGMLTDQLKIENTSSDSQSIEKELIERLQRLRTA